ncbi:hypothetical protein FOZ61_003586, partial [Perkinsus olseni]
TRNLFFGASLLEHSCNPNAFVFVHGREASVIAQVPISIGEPVSVSYIDAFAPTTIRRQLLSAKFSFQCYCPVCTDAADRARAFRCGFCGGMVYGRSDCATGYTNCMSCGAQQDSSDLALLESSAEKILLSGSVELKHWQKPARMADGNWLLAKSAAREIHRLTREQPTRYDADNSELIIAQASVALTAHRIYWRRECPVYVWSALKRAVLSLCRTADGDGYIAAEIRDGSDDNSFTELLEAY